MLITKEQQEAWVDAYVKEKHNSDECIGFIDGVNKALDVVKNNLVQADVMHSLTTADDNTYMQIINYGLQWGGKNPLGWKTGQDVVDYAKSKHKLFKGNER